MSLSETASRIATYQHDPDAVLDYVAFWCGEEGNELGDGGWLQGQQIDSHEVIVSGPDGLLTVSNSEVIPLIAYNDDGEPTGYAAQNVGVRFWIAAPGAAGEYLVTCRVRANTTPQRVDDRSMIFKVGER